MGKKILGLKFRGLENILGLKKNFLSPKALPIADKKKEDDDSYTWGRRLRKKTWKFLEEPDTSLAAKTFSVSSILFILLSTISFCIETLPKYDDSFIWNQTAQKWQFNHTTFHLQLSAQLEKSK